jgi:hypothetical protein
VTGSARKPSSRPLVRSGNISRSSVIYCALRSTAKQLAARFATWREFAEVTRNPSAA